MRSCSQSLCLPSSQHLKPKTSSRPVYLSPKYVAPQDAPSSIVVAGKEEPGERMIVTGQATARGKSLAGVSVYVFHADAAGLYFEGRAQ